MRIKTYTSESVSKALGQIRAELGPGAVILNTKKKSKSRFFGLIPSLQYEITAAAEPLAEPQPEPVQLRQPPAGDEREFPVDCYEVAEEHPTRELEVKGRPGAPFGPVESQLNQLGNDIAELRNLVKTQLKSHPIRSLLLRETGKGLGELIWGDGCGGGDLGRASVICEQFERLVSQGVEDGLAFFLNQGAAQRLPAGEDAEDRLKIRLNKEISDLIRTSPLGGEAGVRVCAFIGPTGVGKTTTIAKLAAQLALKDREKVQLLTLDTYRIAAAEQLKTYGQIIGVPVRILFSIQDLNDAISRADPGDYLLIDTTGHNYRKATEFSELAEYLRNNPRIETHLVLSANTNPEDMRLAIDGFEVFEPDKLLFTKLDESSSFGAIVNELVRTVKPLSYLTNGQNVPDDLIVPSPATVADLVVPIN